MVNLKIKDQISQPLVNTGASESFIHADIVKKLNFNPKGGVTEVALASTSNSAKINGFIEVNASVLGNDYLLKVGLITHYAQTSYWERIFSKFMNLSPLKWEARNPLLQYTTKKERRQHAMCL